MTDNPLPVEQCDPLECLFCGGTDIRFTNHGTKERKFGDTHTDALHYGDTIWSTCCYQCGATFPNMYSREKLEEKWRQRPATRPQPDREWLTVTADTAHYVDQGRETILCDRLPHPVTLVLKNPVLHDGAFFPSAVDDGLPHPLADRVGTSAASSQPDREAIARVINPVAWKRREHALERAAHWETEPANDVQANLARAYRDNADRHVAASLAKADAILALAGDRGVIEACARVAEEYGARDWFEVGKVVRAASRDIAANIRSIP